MKKFSDYENTQTFVERPKLPKDAYILRILNAEEIEYTWGRVLKLDFDIAEGDQKDFYKRDYNLQTQEDKKWKGSYRLNIPKDDGSEQDAWTKMRFKTVMEAFENSNANYRWDWDEKKLKGKLIGGLFNLKEWEFNNNTGWFTQCKKLVSIDDIRNKNFTLPADEPLKDKKPAVSEPAEGEFMNIPDGFGEELPFD